MTGPNGDPPPDDLPPPEIETIRNFAGLPQHVRSAIRNGALLALDGDGVRDHSIDISVLSEVLVHFDRLFRIMRAYKSGFEVKRSGRLVEVAGSRHLAVLPAVAGSFVVPLRLEDPEGEMVVEDHQELEEVMNLLAPDEGESFSDLLSDLPERVGDELYWLLHTLVAGDIALAVEAVRDGEVSRAVEMKTELATRRSAWLTELVRSEVGVDTLRGRLFRIDTKRARIAVDVSQEDDESTVVEEASFQPEQLEDLREALNHQVEIEVSVVEERRHYERTARSRTMAVTAVHKLMPEGE